MFSVYHSTDVNMKLLGIKILVERLFSKHLFVTNTTLGIVFMGAGDSIQQLLERKLLQEKPHDPKRTGNMMTVGFGFGLLAHWWYKMLDSKFPGRSAGTIAKKLTAEMAIGPPLILDFFIGLGFLEQKTAKESFEEFKKNFVIICLADWAVYAPLQGLNFYFLPPRYRVLYVCALTLVYDIFLSYITHKETNKHVFEKDAS